MLFVTKDKDMVLVLCLVLVFFFIKKMEMWN